MEFDDLAEIMASPPGGENFGRSWTDEGSKHYLDNSMASILESDLIIYEDPRAQGRRSRKPEGTVVHGTRSAYINDRCRCDICREAQREYMQGYRNR